MKRRSLFSLFGLLCAPAPVSAAKACPPLSAMWFPPGYSRDKLAETLVAFRSSLPPGQALEGRLEDDGSWVYRITKPGRAAPTGWMP